MHISTHACSAERVKEGGRKGERDKQTDGETDRQTDGWEGGRERQ